MMKKCVIALLVLVVWCGGVSAGNPLDNNKTGKKWKNIGNWNNSFKSNIVGDTKVYKVAEGSVFTISMKSLPVASSSNVVNGITIKEKISYRIVRFSKIKKIKRNDSSFSDPIKGDSYLINENMLGEGQIKEGSHITYGMLAIPYKYFSSNGDVLPGGSLGGFLGWDFSGLNTPIPMSVIVSGGITTITTTNINATDTETGNGLYYAFGLVFPLDERFQIGALYGKDYISDDEGDRYVHNKEWWLSVQIGFAFIK